MVLTITETWKFFVQETDFSGNIANSMEEATRNNPAKMKIYNSKKAVTKVKKICAKKSSRTISRQLPEKLKSQ